MRFSGLFFSLLRHQANVKSNTMGINHNLSTKINLRNGEESTLPLEFRELTNVNFVVLGCYFFKYNYIFIHNNYTVQKNYSKLRHDENIRVLRNLPAEGHCRKRPVQNQNFLEITPIVFFDIMVSPKAARFGPWWLYKPGLDNNKKVK